MRRTEIHSDAVPGQAGPAGTQARSKRLRSPRYRPADLHLGSLEAIFEHHHDRARATGKVVDFSAQGIGLAIEGVTCVFLAGDTLPYLRVFDGDDTFYEGTAVVRHIREEEGRVLVGLALQDAWIDMGKLYDHDLRLDLEERFTAFLERRQVLDRIRPAFKLWVADVRSFLDGLHAHLAAEEEQLRNLDKLTREAAIRHVVDVVADPVSQQLLGWVRDLNQIVMGLDQPLHDLHRSYFQHHLNALFMESPLLSRAFRKPLGYAGDYEVMNMFYRDHREGASIFGQVVNIFALRLSASRAVINRSPFLSRRLAEILRSRPRARIASLGCGPAKEIQDLITGYGEVDGATVTLLDVEPRAIQYCEKVLLSLLRETGRNVRIQFIRESIRYIIQQEHLDKILAPQDVVISVGLFDYFSEKIFKRLLSRAYDLVVPGGELLIGNFNVENDSRIFMEYMTEWYLHHRSPDDLLALASDLPREATVTVESEPENVNLFLRVRKP